jgi:hypothetical protein
MLEALNGMGVDVCYASRDVKLVSEDWRDKSPWPVTLAYMYAFTRGKVPAKMAVPKAVKF